MAVDADAEFSEWLYVHRTQLLRSALLLTGDRALADDLVQEASIKVAQRWGQLRTQQPMAYARQIIYRDHVSWWRRRRETPTAEIRDRAAIEADPAHRTVVLTALAALPRGQRAVVVLRYFEDLTERQTAEVLGIAIGTVKSQAHDALRTLRATTGLLDLIGKESTQ